MSTTQHITDDAAFGFRDVVPTGGSLFVRSAQDWDPLLARLRTLGYDVSPGHESKIRPDHFYASLTSGTAQRGKCKHCGALISACGLGYQRGRRCEACGKLIYWFFFPGARVQVSFDVLRPSDERYGGIVRERFSFWFEVFDFDVNSQSLVLQPIPLPDHDHDEEDSAHVRAAAAAARIEALRPHRGNFHPVTVTRRFDAETDSLVDLPQPLELLALPYERHLDDERPWCISATRCCPDKGSYRRSTTVTVFDGVVYADSADVPAPQSLYLIPAWADYPRPLRPGLHNEILTAVGLPTTLDVFVDYERRRDHARLVYQPLRERQISDEDRRRMRRFVERCTAIPLADWDALVARHGTRHASEFILEMARLCSPESTVRWAWHSSYGADERSLAQAETDLAELDVLADRRPRRHSRHTVDGYGYGSGYGDDGQRDAFDPGQRIVLGQDGRPQRVRNSRRYGYGN